MLTKYLPRLFNTPKILSSKRMLFQGVRNFVAISNPSQKRFQQIRLHTTMSEYQGLNAEMRKHTKNEVEVITDPGTGLRFLIQRGGFTGCSDIGICIKLGSQDSSPANSGSLQYLKSFVHNKPTFQQLINNYQFLHQTGSTFDLHYDTMTTYARCSFLEEDQDLMADLLLDLVLQEKNMFQDNYRMEEMANLDVGELVRRTAFGGVGIGMPGKGVGNVLTNQQFLKFQQKITPSNTIISMSNITNPPQFITSLTQKIRTRYPKFLQRKPQPTPKSIYKGGLGIYKSQNQFFDFAIAFPGVASKSQNMEMFNVLRVLLGSASSFSSGGPGKGMHSRCTKNLMNQYACVERASFINQHFQEQGLFGLTVSGPHKDSTSVIQCTLIQLAKLTLPIPEDELSRAKHILISQIYQNIQRQSDRLQQLTNHIFYYNRVKLYEFENNIRKVTSKQIYEAMNKLVTLKPTFVYSGNQQSLKGLPEEAGLLGGLGEAMQVVRKSGK